MKKHTLHFKLFYLFKATRHTLFFISVLYLFLLIGCEQKSPPIVSVTPETNVPAATNESISLLHNSIEAEVFEHPAEALETWRRGLEIKPALVLLSQNPFLEPTPKLLRKKSINLITDAESSVLQQNSSYPNTNPYILPSMTVDIALRAKLFSELIWVIPSPESSSHLNLQTFIKQLSETGIASPEECATFSIENDIFSGTIRNIPTRVMHLQNLTALQKAAVVHFDASFFAPIYKGEIKTPLFALIYSTLMQLKDVDLKGISVSISRSNYPGDLPLATRFIADVIKELFQKPDLLTKALPQKWAMQKKALFLPNFFKDDESLEIYKELEALEPNNPSALFGQYDSYRRTRNGDMALMSLTKATNIDPLYGLEFINLAELAKEKATPQEVVRMMRFASTALPNDPFITLQLALLLNEQGLVTEAIPLANRLQMLDWSPIYYPDINQILKKIQTAKAP